MLDVFFLFRLKFRSDFVAKFLILRRFSFAATKHFRELRGVILHVDAAHGGSLLVSERFRHLLDGIEAADSVTWDTHKLFATSSLCGVSLFRRKEDLSHTFLQKAPYLFGEERIGEDISQNTIECTKAMLSLKLFFNLAVVGEKGLAAHVENLIDKTSSFYKLIHSRKGFECFMQPTVNILCFRYGKNSELQARIREKLVQQGDFYITRAVVNGKTYLRLVIMNPFTEEKHIHELCSRIEDIAKNLSTKSTRLASSHA